MENTENGISLDLLDQFQICYTLFYGFQIFLMIWNMFQVHSVSRSWKKVKVKVAIDSFQVDWRSKSYSKIKTEVNM